jgi:C-terminal processing protease CtpA/Prc
MRHVLRWWAALLSLALLSAPAAAQRKSERQPLPSLMTKKKKGKGWTWPMKKKRPYVGILATQITEELRAHFGAPKGVGMLVARVDPESPAARAGVQVGDVLVGLNDQKVRSQWDVIDEIFDGKKGDPIKLRLIRARKPLTLTATLDVREKKQIEVGRIIMTLPGLGSVRQAMDRHLKRFQKQEQLLKHRLLQMERKLHRLERDLPASP